MKKRLKKSGKIKRLNLKKLQMNFPENARDINQHAVTFQVVFQKKLKVFESVRVWCMDQVNSVSKSFFNLSTKWNRSFFSSCKSKVFKIQAFMFPFFFFAFFFSTFQITVINKRMTLDWGKMSYEDLWKLFYFEQNRCHSHFI